MNTIDNSVALQDIEDREISILDLLAILFKYKFMIIGAFFFGGIVSVLLAIISLKLPPEKSFMPNIYTSEAHLIISDGSKNTSVSSLLSGTGLGGLSSMLNGTETTNSKLASYLISSNSFYDAMIEKLEINKRESILVSKTPKTSARRSVAKMIYTKTDDATGIVTIGTKHIDPVYAKEVLDYAIEWLSQRFDELGVDQNKISKINLEKSINLSFMEIQKLQNQANDVQISVSKSSGWIPSISLETGKIEMELQAQREVYTQLKSQYELLKVKMESETPVFQILDYPEVSDMKAGPSRGKYCIILTFASGFFAIFLAFALNAYNNIKNNPELLSKFLKK